MAPADFEWQQALGVYDRLPEWIGVLPPAARTEGGRRLYDAACVARLELVATLR